MLVAPQLGHRLRRRLAGLPVLAWWTTGIVLFTLASGNLMLLGLGEDLTPFGSSLPVGISPILTASGVGHSYARFTWGVDFQP